MWATTSAGVRGGGGGQADRLVQREREGEVRLLQSGEGEGEAQCQRGRSAPSMASSGSNAVPASITSERLTASTTPTTATHLRKREGGGGA